jgi:Holliday junction resolvase RusA-like endonuclease
MSPRKAPRPAADFTANRPRAIYPAGELEYCEATTKINCVQEKTVAFVVEASPIGKGRPRFGRGHVYTPQKTRDYENQIGWTARSAMAGRPPISGPVRVVVLFELARTKTTLGRAVLPVGRPDLDNLTKSVLDALNKIIFEDDCQVVELMASKTFGKKPKVSISVAQICGAP